MEKTSCTVRASNETFGGDPCFGTTKSLTVQAICGRRRGGGDPHTQWGAACTADDERANYFPYGNTYDPRRCNGRDADAGLLPVKSFPECQGAHPGVYDMSGSVLEWQDGCDVDNGRPPGAEHHICYFRGGSFTMDGNAMNCGATFLSERRDVFDDVGFRCCTKD
jgi:formylglycine-generating enzyme required for sulfatase activity